MTPNTSAPLPQAERAELEKKIARLEHKLHAKEKTIQALIQRAERQESERPSSFQVLEQNVALERVVRDKTTELQGEKSELREALDELKRTQAKLLQAQKLEAIGQLAAGIAHEINTPTQYVSDNVTFLQRAFENLSLALQATTEVLEAAKRGAVPEEVVTNATAVLAKAKIPYLTKHVPRALEQSVEGLGRISTIVLAMKEFSHPSGTEKQPVNIHEAIEKTVTIARNEWKYVAEVQLDFDESLPPVPLLRNEFNQVILNLVVNAAHAIGAASEEGTAPKGRIRLTTRRLGDSVEVQIADTGAGIPEKIRARVFEPFFTTKAVGKGTGQGLAIAYSVIVDKHRGQISFESHEGVGTTFKILLPLTLDAASDSRRGS